MTFAGVYSMYIQKAKKKGRTKAEVDKIIFWLTGYGESSLAVQIDNGADFEAFFEAEPRMNPNASLITGVICGYRVEEIEDAAMQKIRQLDKRPAALPIYKAAETAILTAFPDVRIKIGKTRVSFYHKHLFAALWPPVRKFKGRAELYVGLTFGLGHRAEHPRIVQSAEPYPGRWTHHVLIVAPDEIDAQIMAWLREAYDFSMNK